MKKIGVVSRERALGELAADPKGMVATEVAWASQGQAPSPTAPAVIHCRLLSWGRLLGS